MGKPQRAYTTSDVQELTGFSQSLLDNWAATGLAAPEVAHPHVKGRRRYYSSDDVLLLLTIKLLKEEGWTTQRVRRNSRLLRAMTKPPHDDSASSELAIYVREKVRQAQAQFDALPTVSSAAQQLRLPW